jgi:hypothetical protein
LRNAGRHSELETCFLQNQYISETKNAGENAIFEDGVFMILVVECPKSIESLKHLLHPMELVSLGAPLGLANLSVIA